MSHISNRLFKNVKAILPQYLHVDIKTTLYLRTVHDVQST